MFRLEKVIKQIIEHEENAREKLYDENKTTLNDKIGRSVYFLRVPFPDPGRRWANGSENWIFDTNSARRIRCECSQQPQLAITRDWQLGPPQKRKKKQKNKKQTTK